MVCSQNRVVGGVFSGVMCCYGVAVECGVEIMLLCCYENVVLLWCCYMLLWCCCVLKSIIAMLL